MLALAVKHPFLVEYETAVRETSAAAVRAHAAEEAMVKAQRAYNDARAKMDRLQVRAVRMGLLSTNGRGHHGLEPTHEDRVRFRPGTRASRLRGVGDCEDEEDSID